MTDADLERMRDSAYDTNNPLQAVLCDVAISLRRIAAKSRALTDEEVSRIGEAIVNAPLITHGRGG